MARLARPFTRRVLRVIVGVLACGAGVALVAGLVLFRPLPEGATRWLLLRSATYAVADYKPSSSFPFIARLQVLAERQWTNLLEFNLVHAVVERVPVPQGLDDPAFIIARIAPLRRLMLSQNELPHLERDSLAFLSGFGYCDQINRVGAIAVADRFVSAELYGIFTPDRVGNHVIGRVWSREFDDWLYFDLWPVRAVVFRFRPDQDVQVLAESCDVAGADAPARDADAAAIYKEIPHGYVLNEYRTTLGSYLWSRRSVPAVQWGASVSADKAAAGPRADESVSTDVAAAYVRRRLDLLLPADPTARPSDAPLPIGTTHPRGDELVQYADTKLRQKATAPVQPPATSICR